MFTLETPLQLKLRDAYRLNDELGNASRVLMCNSKKPDGHYVYNRGKCGNARYCLRHDYLRSHINRERLISTFYDLVQSFPGTKFYSITAVCRDTDLHTLRQSTRALDEGLRALHSTLGAYSTFSQFELVRSTVCAEYAHSHLHISAFCPYRTPKQNQLANIWHEVMKDRGSHLHIQQFSRSELLDEIRRAEQPDTKFLNIFAYNTKPFVLGLDEFSSQQIAHVIQSLKGLKLNQTLLSKECKYHLLKKAASNHDKNYFHFP